MKKIAIAPMVIMVLFSIAVYSHQQPTNKDVMNLTKKWSESVEDVLFLREIVQKCMAIFGIQHSVTLAELSQNWFGTWQFKHDAPLSTTTYPSIVENQFTWSASGKSKENATYYFGIVTDPEIDYIQ